MQDPMNWSLPLYRAFGIQVRIHLLFFIVTLGLFMRSIGSSQIVSPFDVFCFTIVLLFVTVLLHEYGHCIGGRLVDGFADKILIWPLGGLAYVGVPHHWRAHTIMIIAGPLVNVIFCMLSALAMIGAGFVPSFNPLSNPYIAEVRNFHDHRDYTSEYAMNLYRPGTAELVESAISKPENLEAKAEKSPNERALAPIWVVWLQRVFWLNWVLILFNMIPAYPMDGGQILMGILWRQYDYRTGVRVSSHCGYIVGVLFLMISIASNEAIFMGLGLFNIISSWKNLHSLETEQGIFGYDFSAGYTSLEAQEEKPAPPGLITRWMEARRAKKLQRELEARQQDETRMDELLEKIAREGRQSLTSEEKRFMERVSARYRKD